MTPGWVAPPFGSVPLPPGRWAFSGQPLRLQPIDRPFVQAQQLPQHTPAVLSVPGRAPAYGPGRPVEQRRDARHRLPADVHLFHVHEETARSKVLTGGDFRYRPDGLGQAPGGCHPLAGGALFDPGIRGFLNDIGRKVKLSSEKAERLLGWEARPVEETIVECARSLLEREKRSA